MGVEPSSTKATRRTFQLFSSTKSTPHHNHIHNLSKHCNHGWSRLLRKLLLPRTSPTFGKLTRLSRSRPRSALLATPSWPSSAASAAFFRPSSAPLSASAASSYASSPAATAAASDTEEARERREEAEYKAAPRFNSGCARGQEEGVECHEMDDFAVFFASVGYPILLITRPQEYPLYHASLSIATNECFIVHVWVSLPFTICRVRVPNLLLP